MAQTGETIAYPKEFCEKNSCKVLTWKNKAYMGSYGNRLCG